MVNKIIKNSKLKDLPQRLKDVASSLWLFDRDEDTGKDGFYGGFVGQVAENLILRYTSEEDWVFDPMAGSLTTERYCQKHNRKCVSGDIYFNEYEEGDDYIRLKFDISKYPYDFFGNLGLFNLVILHPPYHDIIDYSKVHGESPVTTDLSRQPNIKLFNSLLLEGILNVLPNLREGGYLALIMGDIYQGGELYPSFNIAGNISVIPELTLKSIFIKNIKGNETGKGKNRNLWIYRALKGGYSLFEHEYIYVWEKNG